MRSGTWDGPRTDDNVRVTVDGVRRPVKNVTIRRGMRDGHPASQGLGSGAWCVECTIEWAGPDDMFAGAPEPFTGDSWLPREGQSVVVETGDGALGPFGSGAWWVQHRGVIDSTKGSIADGTATSETVDAIEELTSRVGFGALTARMPPLENIGGQYREPGLTSTYMVDRMLRQPQDWGVGWHATPPLTWETVGSAPCQGSLWPERGNLVTGHRAGNIFAGPSVARTTYGIMTAGYTATYLLSGSVGEVIISCGLGYSSSATAGSVTAANSDGAGFFIGHDTSTDEITYGATTTGGTVTYRLPRQGATRAALYARRNTTTSQTIILRTSDGREVTRDPGATGYPNGWAATRALVDGRGIVGWWMIEGPKPASGRWATLDHQPTARIRVGDIPWWAASRDLPWADPSEWLAEQVDAECAAMWLDEDGVMQWAGRGVLDAQPVAQTVTSDLDLDDVQWQSRRRSMARGVWVQYLEPNVRQLLHGPRQNAWATESVDLGAGESEVIVIDVPDDEDWIGIDLNSALMGAQTTSALLRIGSKHGGTLYTEDSQGDEGSQSWAIGPGVSWVRKGLRAVELTVWTPGGMSSSQRIRTAIPDTSDRLTAWHHGRPALRLRAKGITSWTDGQRSLTAGSVGPARYTHDAGWRVQRISDSTDPLGDLLSWLRGVVSSTSPTVTGLIVAHDPRRQVGDKIRIQDRHVTGLWIDVLCQDITTDVHAFEDEIVGRATAWGTIPDLHLHAPGGHTAMTPVTDWTREIVS